MSALAEGLVGSPDPEDDALVDLGEETVHAALFKEKDAPASPEPRRAVASLDLGPHTAQRRLLDEALDAGWDLDERCGALRPPERLRGGAPNPLACLAECGDPQCGCNRLRNPTVRGSFALKILDNAAPQRPAPGRGGFRSFVAARRLVYASVGCGLLYFDFDVVRRLRKRLAVSTVVLVDEIYREDPPEALGAFAAYFYDVEVLYFGSIAAYRAAVRRDGRLAADVLVQCDACSIPRDEVAPLLFFALKVGGAAFKLYNSGHARPDDDDGGGARRNREARVHAEWWRRRGDESRGLASVDYAGARGVLETAATGSTASMWARLWADQRAGVADRARRDGRRRRSGVPATSAAAPTRATSGACSWRRPRTTRSAVLARGSATTTRATGPRRSLGEP